MLKFTEKPNLPENDVKLLFIGEKYAKQLRLERIGISVIPVPEDPKLETPVQDHADMQVVHLYSDKFLISPYYYCKAESLYNSNLQIDGDIQCKANALYRNFIQGSTSELGKYPQNAAYNVLLVGEYAFYNPKCIDKTLEQWIRSCYKPVLVKQGYARCSCCIVQENAVITADEGMNNALEDAGIEVLLIRPGFIELPGYNYGFIGGASFKISKDKLAFTGTLDRHPDKDRILNFLSMHGVLPVYLTGEPVFDIGSAIPVLETE